MMKSLKKIYWYLVTAIAMACAAYVIAICVQNLQRFGNQMVFSQTGWHFSMIGACIMMFFLMPLLVLPEKLRRLK